MSDTDAQPESQDAMMDPPLSMEESTAVAAGRLTTAVRDLTTKVDGLQGELKTSNERAERAEKQAASRLRGIYGALAVLLVLLCGLGALGAWVYDSSTSTDDRFGRYTDQAVVNCRIRNQGNDGLRNLVTFLGSKVADGDVDTQNAIDQFLKSIPSNLDCSKLKV